ASCRRGRVDGVSRVFIYKTYTIRSTPLQLLDSKQWMLSIVIDWEGDGRVTGRPFSATEKPTRQKRKPTFTGSPMANASLTERSQGFLWASASCRRGSNLSPYGTRGFPSWPPAVLALCCT